MKKKWIDLYYKLFWTFVFGSVFGYVYEMVLNFLKHGSWESRQGLLYGPFSQVYGLGAVIFLLVLSHFKNKKTIFLAGTILGGIAEFICSWVQEFVFGSLSWNYSKYFLNIDGRTSPFHMIAWGLIGLFFMLYIYPLLLQMVASLKNKKGAILTVSISIILLIDIMLSITAAIRQTEREKNIPADNIIRETMDRWYPDSFMEKVYPNKKSIVKTT